MEQEGDAPGPRWKRRAPQVEQEGADNIVESLKQFILQDLLLIWVCSHCKTNVKRKEK